MGEVIAVVSGKGGTGKTSFVAGVGAALAILGKRVLCIDCDVGLRNLDISLGLSDRALMDFFDVAREKCTLEEAAVVHPKIANLFLLTAPVSIRGGWITPEQMRGLIRQVKSSFDYCFLDAPAGLDTGFRLATCAADRAVVVSTTDITSLRDAQRTVMLLDSKFGQNKLHLVVNRVRRKMLRNLHSTIDDAIDTAGAPLLGIVPEDEVLPMALNRGIPLLLVDSPLAAKAYYNIAQRITGLRVPLMKIR